MKRTNWKRRRRIEDILIMAQIALVAAFAIAVVALVIAKHFCVMGNLPREPTRSDIKKQ